jgi:hypothetical protein
VGSLKLLRGGDEGIEDCVRRAGKEFPALRYSSRMLVAVYAWSIVFRNMCAIRTLAYSRLSTANRVVGKETLPLLYSGRKLEFENLVWKNLTTCSPGRSICAGKNEVLGRALVSRSRRVLYGVSLLSCYRCNSVYEGVYSSREENRTRQDVFAAVTEGFHSIVIG